MNVQEVTIKVDTTAIDAAIEALSRLTAAAAEASEAIRQLGTECAKVSVDSEG